MIRRSALLLSFFFFNGLALVSFGQTAIVFGVVKDSLNKPLFGATISVFGQPIGTSTQDDGKYELTVPAGQELKIVFSFTGLKADTFFVNLNTGAKKEINKKLSSKVFIFKDVTIVDQSLKTNNVTRINPRIVSVIPTPNQSVEDLLKTLPGVNSTNELSSAYSVRGGNYDENLVYINDFEVFRPLLIRSGQQEGLSIVNPDLVENINFSAGGFDAVYGDKMSSVLDIKYRKPKTFAGAVNLSLLGGGLSLENRSKNGKWYYMTGLRQKSNRYLLNTFETKGEYVPSFTDIQVLSGFEPSSKFNVEVFFNYARNQFSLVPTNRETNFGTINDAKRFTVYFEGQEQDRYLAATGALSLTYKPKSDLSLKLITTAYKTDERENYDILGQYYLDQLETDLGKSTFGNVAFNLGVGSFLNHARNRLNATVVSTEHKGELIKNSFLLQWGLRYQHEQIEDRLHEWYYNDSSGFSIPSIRDTINPQILLNDVVISRNNLSSNRMMGYVQATLQLTDTNRILITGGIRANYWDLNQELVISPRASITMKPQWNRRLTLRASGGFYYQPPFYRELRDLEGKLYPNTQAQRSIHAVVGGDYIFLAFGREYKLTGEVFYKQLDHLIPYKVQEIRIRYLPNFVAKGYSQGIDFRVNGEFVPGAESWISISYLQTKEDLIDDHYYLRYNAEGEQVIPGYTFDQLVTDSVRVNPGYIPRPTDQRISFSVFFQDYLPKFPTYKMQLNLLFGTGLPFGPPGKDRFKDLLRTPTYRRVDIGFSKQLIGDEVKHKPNGAFLKTFNSVWIGLEVFNLLQVSNVASYTWITDVTNNRKYAVPNYLTARQLNVRLNARF